MSSDPTSAELSQSLKAAGSDADANAGQGKVGDPASHCEGSSAPRSSSSGNPSSTSSSLPSIGPSSVSSSSSSFLSRSSSSASSRSSLSQSSNASSSRSSSSSSSSLSYNVGLVLQKPTRGSSSSSSTSSSSTTLTLKHDNLLNLEVNVTPAGAVVTEYRIEVRRSSAATWGVIGHTRTLAPWTAKIAGKFKIRGVAKIHGRDVLSAENDVEVQFPTYAQIVGDTGVQTASNAEWTATLNDCTSSPNQRREHGFWINLNTTTGNYQFGPTAFGAFNGPSSGAAVNLPPRPADVPATPAATDNGATYPVASFHAHTATEFRAAAFPAGAQARSSLRCELRISFVVIQ